MKREYPDAPVAAVGVVVLNGDEVLLVRRGKEPRRGRWSLPGGAVELGETVRQAGQREIREECDVEVRATEVIEVLDAISPDGDGRVRFHYVLTELLAEYLGGTPSAHSDALEVRWFSLEDLDGIDILPMSTRIIREGAELRRRMASGALPTEGRAWQSEFWS